LGLIGGSRQDDVFEGAKAAVFQGLCPAPPIIPADQSQRGTGARLTGQKSDGVDGPLDHSFAGCEITTGPNVGTAEMANLI
jgi:hypothetical protein